MRGFWIAAGVLLVVLMALIPVIDNGSVAVPDDGVYAAQAKLLSEGSWSMQRPAAAIDSNGLNSAIAPDFIYRDRQIPYPRHPLFVTALAPLFRLGGIGGLMVFSTTGTWLAAVAAGLLARRLDPRLGIPALVVMGVGSPLLFDAFLVSAHAMAAAACGFVALGIAQVVEDRRRWPLAYLLVCVAGLVALRTEGTIVMVLTAGVVGLMAVEVRRRPRLDGLAATTAVAIGVVTVLTYLADAWWTRSIKDGVAGGTQPLIRGLSSHRDPLGATWASLLRPWPGDNYSAQTAIVIAVVAVILAAVSVKVAPRRWLLPVALTATAAGCLIYQNVVTPVLITGLVGAFPLVVAGTILLRFADLRSPMVLRHLAICALSVVTITVTSYEVGGAVEWGGRFYHLLLPLLVPLVVLGLRHGYDAMPRRPAIAAAAAVAVGAVALAGLIVQQHRWLRQVTRATTSAAESLALGGHRSVGPDGRPLVVMGLLSADGSARMFWDPSGPVDVVTAAGVPDLFRLVALAKEHGYPDVTLVTDIPPSGLMSLSRRPLSDLRWTITSMKAVDDTPFGLVRLAPAGDRG